MSFNTPVPWYPEPKTPEIRLVDRDLAQANFEEFIDLLRRNPGRRLAWSSHQTRGAARQRVNALRRSLRWSVYPEVVFETHCPYPTPDSREGVKEPYYITVHIDAPEED